MINACHNPCKTLLRALGLPSPTKGRSNAQDYTVGLSGIMPESEQNLRTDNAQALISTLNPKPIRVYGFGFRVAIEGQGFKLCLA